MGLFKGKSAKGQSSAGSSKPQSSSSTASQSYASKSSNFQLPSTSSGSASKPRPPPPQQQWTIPMPAFKIVQYVPKGNDSLILARRVIGVHAVAHKLLTDGGNHWCFYLAVAERNPDDDVLAVRIDPNPSGIQGPTIRGGSKANLVVSELPYLISNQAQHVVKLSFRQGLRVQDFMKAILDNGREKYEFDAAGRGCRQWTSDQISLFLQLQLLTSSREAAAVQDDILTEYNSKRPTGRRYALAPGAYYQ